MRKTIFVHGIFGWGESDPLWKVLPNWGMATGDLMAYLRTEGYDVAASSIGPISSAWDRACELYAELTGTTTDYGAVHAAKYGHKRFGKTYEKALAPDWSAENPIDLVAHSFGGTTVRLLAHLLDEGCEEECAGTEGDVSELFTGKKGNWIKTICCVASPHNGSTLFDAWPDFTHLIEKVGVAAAKVTGISDLKGLYDFKLEHYGFVKKEDETLVEAIRRVVSSGMNQKDWAADDLKVDVSLENNKKLTMIPGIRYISLPGMKTKRRRNGSFLPRLTMTAPLQPSSIAMCRFTGQRTEGGTLIDDSWGPNDGLVNTLSARCPLDEPFVDCTFREPVHEGVWNILPTETLDHYELQGGTNPLLRRRFRALYKRLMEKIHQGDA